ncbi:hemicentin-2-like [Rhinoraja longicauda]
MMRTSLLWALLTLALGVVADPWEVRASRNVMAAVGTCVRIPCSFHPGWSQLKTVQWLKGDQTQGTLVVSSDQYPDPLHSPSAEIPQQWQRDNDCTLTIDSLTKRDEGRYFLRMENSQGEKYSGPDGVLLNVSDESSLVNISSPAEIKEGDEVVLTCSVRFACPGRLRWSGIDGLDSDSETETPGSVANSWTTSLTLRFQASHSDHGRSLRCVHTPSENTGNTITLNVKRAVADSWEVRAPRNVMAAVGTCVRIPCSFSRPFGSRLKTVQWLKGDQTQGTHVVSSDQDGDPLRRPIAEIPKQWQRDKDCTLTIDSLTKRDEGWYYFRMENKLGEKYSGPDGVQLNVSDESSLVNISSPAEIKEGDEVVLTCSVRFACPGRLRWSGVDGLDSDSETETPGSVANSWTTSLTLRFQASHSDHGRSLRCVHTTSENTGNTITLNVKRAVADSWEVRAPRNVMAAVGTCVRIPCYFSRPFGSRLKTVQWLKGDQTQGTHVVSSDQDGDPLRRPIAEIPKQWQRDKDCTLTIDSLTKRDEGWYYFRMENKLGEKYSGPDGVLLNVSDESSLVNISSPAEITERDEVVLTCSVRFTCPGRLRWSGIDGLDSASETETPGSDANSWTTSLTLRFQASHLDHGRSLRCVHTPSESTGNTITLNVKYAPKSVLLTLSSSMPTRRGMSFSLRCAVGSSYPPVTSYRWYKAWYGSSQMVETQTPTYSLANSMKDTDYWCQAVNSVGKTDSDKTKLPFYGAAGWAVWTPVSVRSRDGGCVTIPCRFRVSQDTYVPWTGMWLKDDNFRGTRVYTTSGGSGDDYKQRVRFEGSMEDQNCSLTLKDLRSADSGKYFFRLEGSDKWSDPIGVNLLVSGEPEMPVIGDPGQVVVGKAVSLTCSLHSYCPDDAPQFLWHPPPLNPAETLVVYQDQHWVHSSMVEHLPTYEEREVFCNASFGIGTLFVRTARTLKVMFQPRNVTASLSVIGMRGRTLREGDRVHLSCSSVAAYPPVQSYTWYRNGTEIQRRTSPDLEYSSISYPDFGKYVCQATNEVGSTRSAELTLRGKYKPQGVYIESRVNDVQVGGAVNNVNKYGRLSLTCASHVSDPPVSGYSWYRNGRVYGSAQSLVFDRITPEQAGLYRCTAENEIGSVSSETITVNVLFQPRDVTALLWVNGMRGRTLREGDRVRLSCSYVTADPPVHEYTWYRNRAEIKRGTSPDLEYPSISYADFGKYVCQATNTVGSTRSAELTLTGKHKPQDIHIESRVNGVQVGRAVYNVSMVDRLILTCASRVSDPPESRYFWYHNGRVNGWRAQSLVFDGITPEQAGPYRCTAENEIGNMSSETITVNVLYAPINVSVVLEAAEVEEGKELTLHCKDKANPPSHRYHWRKDCSGILHDLEGNDSKLVTSFDIADQTCHYYCSATNKIGKRTSGAKTVRVLWSTQRKIIASVTPTLIFLILIIPVVFYIRHVHSRRKQVDSQSNVNIDATNVVYSVVKKTRKISPRASTLSPVSMMCRSGGR